MLLHIFIACVSVYLNQARLGFSGHICNASIREAEAGQSRLQDQSGLYNNLTLKKIKLLVFCSMIEHMFSPCKVSLVPTHLHASVHIHVHTC